MGNFKCETIKDVKNNQKIRPKWWIPAIFFIVAVLIQVISIFIPLLNNIEFSEWKQTPISKILSIAYILLIFGLLLSIFLVIIKYNLEKNKINNNSKKVDILTDEDKLNRAFVGKNYEKIAKKTFSFPALFFNWIYILYRKMYLFAVVGMIVITILNFLLADFFYLFLVVFLIFIGLFFNKIYVSFVENKVNKIKLNNSNANENEIIKICEKTGGTNIWLALLIYTIFVIVNSLL